MATEVCNVQLLNLTQNRVYYLEKSEWLSKNLIRNYTDSISRIIEGVLAKISWDNNIVCRFLEDIWFYIQRKDRANATSISSSSCHAISIDFLDPLSPPLPIVHCFRQVFRATSRIGTELLYVGSSWSSCLCSAMWRGPQEYIPYELVPTSPAVSRMSGSSNLDSFRDGW